MSLLPPPLARLRDQVTGFHRELAGEFEIDELSEADVHRAPTPREASGGRILARAALTAAVGGMIIAGVSAAFSSRLLALGPDARFLGVFCGLLIVALAGVAVIGSGGGGTPGATAGPRTALGAVIVVVAIISFPAAFGGYVVGAMVSIVGGAMLVAYQPTDGAVEVLVERAGVFRRGVALVVDFILAFVLHRILFLLVPFMFRQTLTVLLMWALVWFVVAVEPAILTRRTPGRLLMSLRLADLRTGHRSATHSAIIREVIRGLVSVGTFVITLKSLLKFDVELLRAFTTLAGSLAVVYVLELTRTVDRLSAAITVHESIVPSSSAPPDPVDPAGSGASPETGPDEEPLGEPAGESTSEGPAGNDEVVDPSGVS